MSGGARRRAAPDFASLSDEQLLQLRICDLKLEIRGTELESRIEKFYRELEAKNIACKPICYLGDEWFCPEGSATIAIPFYLAHPRLKRLEEKMMLEVEGGTETWCMRLLRHEMGHVLNHAYLLDRDRRWQKVFGPPSLEYSESFRARPYSKRFVRHLEGWYAQSHPEEDFAETVAIWLTPDLDWRTQYRGWKALEKLEYVDGLMRKLAATPPLAFVKTKMSEASRLRSRLENYYRRRRRAYAQDFPDFFDADLKRLFAEAPASPDGERAAVFLRRSNQLILNAVSSWTGEPKFTVNRLLRALTDRCAQLDLRLRSPLTGVEVTAYLTSLVSHYRLTGKFKDR
ncbi:MAG TPA: putative zinc-binding metallopeptidase [candidate division Zixibacteria bacterium]|nr:putative zinc-binding metallopeptidase [candidate division Zixibacteria bacterium]